MQQRLIGVVVFCWVIAANATTPAISSVSVASPPALAANPKVSANLPDVAASSASSQVGQKTTTNKTASDDEKPVDWSVRTAAYIGLFLSLANICFSLWKLRRDRRLSVEDDFWFRKIVAPTTIEPLIKGVMGLLQEMPERGRSVEDLSEYARKITTEFQKLYPAMQTLGLVDSNWPKLVNDKLRACEDALTEHIGKIIDGELEGSTVELQDAVLKLLNEALHFIKDGHLKK